VPSSQSNQYPIHRTWSTASRTLIGFKLGSITGPRAVLGIAYTARTPAPETFPSSAHTTLLPPWNSPSAEPDSSSTVKKSPAFVAFEFSLSCSQMPAVGLCFEPDGSSPQLRISEIHFNIKSPPNVNPGPRKYEAGLITTRT
jgi:hypothetical protein